MSLSQPWRACCWVALLTPCVPLQAQTIGFWGTTPIVLNAASAPSQVLFTVQITGPVTRASFELDPGLTGKATSITLHDDGLDGDAVAGDHVYSAWLPTAPLIAALRPSDNNRVFAGHLDVYNGSLQAMHGNMFVDIVTPEVAPRSIVPLAPHVQATSRLVNIVLPSYFQGVEFVENVTKEFYRWFPDDYDYINVIYAPARFLNRFHSTTRNDITGIGTGQINVDALHGSAGRLRGITQFPNPAYFDGAETGYLHELGHQWVSSLKFAPLAQGVPHWPYSSMGGGIMGISVGGAGGEGGNFSCDVQEIDGKVVLKPRPGPAVFNDLDLYLMGLIPPAAVRTQFVFNDQVAAQSLACVGQVYTGAVTRLTVQDLIQQVGPRVPAAATSPVQFRVASILVTRDSLASADMMALYSSMAERAEARTLTNVHSGLVTVSSAPFFVATRGLATLDTRIGINEPYVIQGLPVGPLSTRGLTVALRPAAGDVGQTRQVFVAALVGAQWYVRSPAGWQPWNGGAMPAFSTRVLPANLNLQVLDGSLDLTGLVGTGIYAGYGVDAAEMIAKARYALVHTLQ